MNQFFAAMFKLPMDAFLGGMDAVMTSVRGFQDVFNGESDAATIASYERGFDSDNESLGDGDCHVCRCQKSDGRSTTNSSKPTLYTNQTQENIVKYRDEKECHGVNLISYKISFVKENLEAVLLRDGEDIIDDASDCGTSLDVWKTAEFIQTLHERNPPSPGRRPYKWVKNSYPPKKYRTDASGNQHDEGLYYNGIPEEDKKFLRFYQDLLATYERESTDYQEEQAKSLDGINRALSNLPQTIADAVNRGTGGPGI